MADLPGTTPNLLAEQTEQAVPAPRMDMMPYIRQGILLLGLALAVAIGVTVAMWTQEPNYTLLYGSLAQKDAAEVAAAIRSAGVDYKLDAQTGSIMVPADKVDELKLKLASQGLPQGSPVGLEILQQDQSLATSQFVEKARYNHALEQELARTISSIGVVETARVHLALPKQSVFVRKNTKPSASVMVKLYPGRVLEKNQIASIVHIIAASIPKLSPSQVTVVDQHGNLLSDLQDNSELSLSNKEFEYARKVEQHFQHQILSLLEPIVGVGKVKAQVSVDMDFTKVDSAQESYNPEKKVVRSEQISEDEKNTAGASGIPGALSNQPPGEGTTNNPTGGAEKDIINQSRNLVKNYEIDKEIKHVKKQVGELRRISVAVVVDNPSKTDADGKVTVTPFSDEQLLQMKNIIKDAIGFVEERGDRVNITNASFLIPEVEPLPEQAIWEQAWFQQLVKQVLGGLFVIVLLLTVIRPLIKALTTKTLRIDEHGNPLDEYGNPIVPKSEEKQQEEGMEGELQGQELLEDIKEHGNDHSELKNLLETTTESSYEDKLEFTRLMIKDDPKRVANVIKKWVEDNG